MNEIKLFEEKYLETFNALKETTNTIKHLQEQEKKLKTFLEEKMDEYNIKSMENDIVKITRVKESESLSLDVKKFEEEETDLYKEILEDYPKITKRKAYVRFTFK